MPKPFAPKVVTANHLIEGDVVYQTKQGWTRVLAEAEVLFAAAEAESRLSEASAQAEIVVGAYLADVSVQNGEPHPAHFREEFRMRGPSNYPHGKQVDLN